MYILKKLLFKSHKKNKTNLHNIYTYSNYYTNIYI